MRPGDRVYIVTRGGRAERAGDCVTVSVDAGPPRIESHSVVRVTPKFVWIECHSDDEIERRVYRAGDLERLDRATLVASGRYGLRYLTLPDAEAALAKVIADDVERATRMAARDLERARRQSVLGTGLMAGDLFEDEQLRTMFPAEGVH